MSPTVKSGAIVLLARIDHLRAGDHKRRVIESFLSEWGEVSAEHVRGEAGTLIRAMDELGWDATPDWTWRVDLLAGFLAEVVDPTWSGD